METKLLGDVGGSKVYRTPSLSRYSDGSGESVNISNGTCAQITKIEVDPKAEL